MPNLRKYEYEIGHVYGCRELLSLENNNGRTLARARCIHCGKEYLVRPDSLHHRKTNSCQCAIAKRNWLNKSRIYHLYHNMLYRCNTPTCDSYFRYGGAGIRVCEEWSGEDGFDNFYNWAMNNGYDDNLTIDRIDNHGDYCPENCQWITKSENTARANKTVQHRRANKGDYYAIDPDGNMIVFQNANAFCREHTEFDAGRVRSVVKQVRVHTYNGWIFGYVSDLCEPQSTIESTGESSEASRVHAF